MSKTYTPPKSAINNAKRGLDLRKKYGRGGLTPTEAKSYGIDSGITRAKRISKGKLSRHDVRRMSAFNRHRKNYNPSKKMGDGGPSAGTIAWLLWGGTSGVNWAKKKSAAMNAESFEVDDIICICGCDGVMQDHDDRGYGVWECMICRNDSDKDYGFPCSDCEPKNDLKNAEDEIYDYTCLLILKIRDANKDYPLYARLKDGGFALNPLAIIKIKEFILSGLNLNSVDYSGTTITADSVIFKFNFNILDDAEEFSKYVNQFISITFAENHDEIPDDELCPHCMFSEVTITVVDKYEVGIEIASLMDWSDKELTINFLEYLVALENVDMEYTLNLLRERGADIDMPNVVGNSLNELIDIEKDGYESMLEYIINELKNKKRDIDIVAFTLSADNGLKQQIISTMLEMQKIDSRQLSSRLEKQFYFNQGKLQGVEDFLYYFYSDSDNFIFDNI